MADISKKMLNKVVRGVFGIYKDKGMSSLEAVNFIKLQLNDDCNRNLANRGIKTGHGGLLETDGHGILVCAVGRDATKLWPFRLGFKQYNVTAQLGIATDNYYANGKFTEEKPYDHVTKQVLEKACSKFEGNIEQSTCPQFADAYDAKYIGLIINDEHRKNRTSKALNHEISCTDFTPPQFSLKISCSYSLYVGLLIHDLGKELGTCAHVVELQRTHHGPFTIDDALPSYKWSWKFIEEASNNACIKVEQFLKQNNEMRSYVRQIR